MRLVIALLVVLAAAPSHADGPHVGPDGFSICPLTAESFGPCDPLTDATAQKYGVAPDKAAIVALIKRFIAGQDDDTFDELAKSFAPPQRTGGNDTTIPVWFPDRGPDGEPSACFICGLHFVFTNDRLDQVIYAVQGRYAVLWNRVLVVEPQK
jgi:hypothetical protein